jgi:hypothetical protein
MITETEFTAEYLQTKLIESGKDLFKAVIRIISLLIAFL